jgi:very-short-patch-repair endonuclease
MDELNKFDMHADASPGIFRYAKALRAKMTEPEKKLWEFLRKRPCRQKFRRQHPFADYVLDFYCHQSRVAIEVDGDSHSLKIQKEIDVQREKILRSYGVKLIRFKNEDVIEDFESVKKCILDEICQSTHSQRNEDTGGNDFK